MKSVIDRIEGDFAVCELEDGEIRNVPLGELPEGVKEGMVLEDKKINFEETEERSKRIRERMNKLFVK